ncbi:hypothetical protein VTK73DRAFT_409 [Phialemonium thermophilum]|uniref:Uncharacterized protein n=1 Tax=Phialemonium thermophilum TaxID=223376 RepID=A0ABR3XEK5_9PEZI
MVQVKSHYSMELRRLVVTNWSARVGRGKIYRSSLPLNSYIPLATCFHDPYLDSENVTSMLLVIKKVKSYYSNHLYRMPKPKSSARRTCLTAARSYKGLFQRRGEWTDSGSSPNGGL